MPSSSSEFNPPILLLLQLIDLDDPCKTFKYVKFEQEFWKLEIWGILDVYHLLRMALVTFGPGWYGANHLHMYIEGRLLPLIKWGEGMVGDGKQEGGSVEAEGFQAGGFRCSG